MEFKHAPVMPEECISALAIKPEGIYVDGTLGGGGHASLICEELSEIQTDDNNPNDVAKEPHDITHGPDGLRYFAVSRSLPGEKEKEREYEPEELERAESDYDLEMTGGEANAGYLMY